MCSALLGYSQQGLKLKLMRCLSSGLQWIWAFALISKESRCTYASVSLAHCRGSFTAPLDAAEAIGDAAGLPKLTNPRPAPCSKATQRTLLSSGSLWFF